MNDWHGKITYSEKYLPKSRIVHYKIHRKLSGLELGPPQWEASA
jgi:hypothetical protein